MTWQRVGVVLVAWLVAACVLAPIVGRWLRSKQPSICGHCRDTGAVVVQTRPPRAQFCNFCVLGRAYDNAARAAWNQGENR